MTSDNAKASQPVMGRPRVTSRAALERLAFELFAEKGFDETTIDDIATAAGIGRRTFFRYFGSKNDLVWGDFSGELEQLRKLLQDADPDEPMMQTLVRAVVAFNEFDLEEAPWHRQRMELILTVPTLQADATLRYNSWRLIITEFVAARTGLARTATFPVLAGHLVLGAAIAAYELWLTSDGDTPLGSLLESTLRQVGEGLSAGMPDVTST